MFAFYFRAAAASICIFGIFSALGVHNGEFDVKRLLYFTFQTNFLIACMFIVLALRTHRELREKGVHGECCFLPRSCAALLIYAALTVFVFWAFISWNAPNRDVVFSYGNFATHLINPLLFLADYVMFSRPGLLKKRDPLRFLIFPAAYCGIASVLGATGLIFTTPYSDEVLHYPYFFMDYYQYGLWAIPMITMVGFVIAGLGWLLLFIDRRRKAKAVSG